MKSLLKEEIRREFLLRRNSLNQSEIRQKSLLVKEMLSLEKEFKEAWVILSYVNKGSEVETFLLIKEALAVNKRVVVPVMMNNEIIPSEIKSLNELRIGSFGVPEPAKEDIRFISPKIIDLAIIPGVAFDLSCYRLGYGFGYFDRFLRQLDTIKIGLSFEIQIIKSLPITENDIQLDKVITERRIICKRC